MYISLQTTQTVQGNNFFRHVNACACVDRLVSRFNLENLLFTVDSVFNRI